jgi:transposase InsO family protein
LSPEQFPHNVTRQAEKAIHLFLPQSKGDTLFPRNDPKKGVFAMTLSYYADRVNLYHLMQRHPQWSASELAHVVNRSLSWVKKWRLRLRDAPADPRALQQVLQGESHAPKHPPARVAPLVEETILAIRDHPPEDLRRTPGPKAIQYFLARDAQLQLFQLPVPGTRTIYRILKKHQRIAELDKRAQQPIERPLPLSHWQLDFKDVSTVPADAEGKRMHVVEACNIIDVGTSILLDAHVRTDFTAETALECVVQSFETHGLPHVITVDRDPRWVGSARGSDFPSALVRLCDCLGVEVEICDPHHPEQNGFVERYHRTYKQECLGKEHPRTLEEAREVTGRFQDHYNLQRPNQAITCGNQPPLRAFPHLPHRPKAPTTLDPDAWLETWHGMHFERKVDQLGTIRLDLKRYGVGHRYVGQRVTAAIDAPSRSLHIYLDHHLLKTVPLKGMVGKTLAFEEFVTHMKQQARAEQRLRSWQDRRRRTAAGTSP